MQQHRTPLNLHRKAKDFIIGVKRLCIVWMQSSACRKSFAFSQTVCLFQMEKRASPLFQAFFPLQHGFFISNGKEG